MKNFLHGKNMQGYVTRVKVKPSVPQTENCDLLVNTQETDNSKVVTWINNSITQSSGMELAKCDTTKEVWNHFEILYTQYNFDKQYQ